MPNLSGQRYGFGVKFAPHFATLFILDAQLHLLPPFKHSYCIAPCVIRVESRRNDAVWSFNLGLLEGYLMIV